MTRASAVALVLVAAAATAGVLDVLASRRAPGELPRARRAFVALLVLALVSGATLVEVLGSHPGAQRCNGYEELCGRRYDQVTYAGAHNAMASAARHFVSVMQDQTMGRQLRSGVRALLVDAHYWDPAPAPGENGADGLAAELLGIPVATPAGAWWCHSTCTRGAEPLAAGFREVRDFLDANRNEVVTMIVEDYVTRADIAAGVRRSGLLRYVFTPRDDPSFRWPTLATMIKKNQRVVIFSERSTELTAPDWYRNFYRYGMETPFKDQAVSEVASDCRANRGGDGKHLFLLNNFMTTAGGNRTVAAELNDERFVLRHAEVCARVRGHRVNIVAVDFTDRGGVMAAVAVLNGVRKPPS